MDLKYFLVTKEEYKTTKYKATHKTATPLVVTTVGHTFQ